MSRPWKFLFVSSDDLISEWRTRWSRDCFSFLSGMLFALVLCLFERMKFIDETSENDADQISEDCEFWDKIREKSVPKHFKLSLVFFSMTGLVAYAIYIGLCKTKEECDIYTPYITFIPVRIIKFILFS